MSENFVKYFEDLSLTDLLQIKDSFENQSPTRFPIVDKKSVIFDILKLDKDFFARNRKFVFQKNHGKFHYLKNHSDTFDNQKFARKVDLQRTHSLLKTGSEILADQSDIVDWADEPIDDSNTRSCDDDAEAKCQKIKMDDSRSQPPAQRRFECSNTELPESITVTIPNVPSDYPGRKIRESVNSANKKGSLQKPNDRKANRKTNRKLDKSRRTIENAPKKRTDKAIFSTGNPLMTAAMNADKEFFLDILLCSMLKDLFKQAENGTSQKLAKKRPKAQSKINSKKLEGHCIAFVKRQKCKKNTSCKYIHSDDPPKSVRDYIESL